MCRLARADCVVVPCCNGKMDQECQTLANKDDTVETSPNTYPRSAFISNLITRDEYFQVSRAADDENNYEAKCLIEYDRAAWARENGFEVSLLRMEPASCTPKHPRVILFFQGLMKQYTKTILKTNKVRT